MTLIFMKLESEDTPREPATRSRAWYEALFKFFTPRKANFSPEEAFDIIDQNWSRSYNDIKQNGVTF